VPQGLTSNTNIVVALIFTAKGSGKEGEKSVLTKRIQDKRHYPDFSPDTVVVSGEIIFA
jgi:hypothetical protein